MQIITYSPSQLRVSLVSCPNHILAKNSSQTPSSIDIDLMAKGEIITYCNFICIFTRFNQSGYDGVKVMKHESPNARFRQSLRKYDLRSSVIDHHNKTLSQLSRDLSVFQQIMEDNNRILIPPIKPRRRGETRY